MKTITQLEKEKIAQLTFGKKEVLENPDERKTRMADLHRAQTLGNLLQTKVKLIFETADRQIYQVETTVWAVGPEFVSLKGGIYLPINSIIQID